MRSQDSSNDAKSPGALLADRRRVALLLGVSVAHVAKLNASGRIPSPRRLGRAVRWDLDELRRWSDAGCPPRVRWDAMRKAVKS